MSIIIFLAMLPLLFFGGLCFLVGNAVPALMGGSICAVLMGLLLVATTGVQENANEGGLGAGILTIIFFLNAVMLLLGGGIYYIAA